MTEPTEFELLELATPYALHAVSGDERAEIDRWVAAAPPAVAEAFGEEVRKVRETMAVVSAATAVLPNLGDSNALAFTVEPGTGSPQPTGAVLANLPLG